MAFGFKLGRLGNETDRFEAVEGGGVVVDQFFDGGVSSTTAFDKTIDCETADSVFTGTLYNGGNA